MDEVNSQNLHGFKPYINISPKETAVKIQDRILTAVSFHHFYFILFSLISFSTSSSSSPEEQHLHRHRNQIDIQSQRIIMNIINIHFQLIHL